MTNRILILMVFYSPRKSIPELVLILPVAVFHNGTVIWAKFVALPVPFSSQPPGG
jgi:hypothetical protein